MKTVFHFFFFFFKHLTIGNIFGARVCNISIKNKYILTVVREYKENLVFDDMEWLDLQFVND